MVVLVAENAKEAKQNATRIFQGVGLIDVVPTLFQKYFVVNLIVEDASDPSYTLFESLLDQLKARGIVITWLHGTRAVGNDEE